MISLEKIIIHKLNVNGTAPEYSNGIIVPDDPQVNELFINHLKINREQSSVKQAKFQDGDIYIVKNSVSNIRESISNHDFDEVFINQSRTIMAKLFEAAKSTTQSDGIIVFIYYKQNELDNLAILKMEADTSFKVVTNEDNPGIFSLVIDPDALPRKNDKLHKAAFIKLYDYLNQPEDNTDENENENEDEDENENENIETLNPVELFVLDKQSNNGAKFFFEHFLQAEEVSNHSKMLKVHQDVISEFLSTSYIKKLCDNDVPQNDAYAEALNLKATFDNQFFNQRHFNFDLVAEQVFNTHNKYIEILNKDQFIDEIKDDILKVVPDAVFEFRIEKPKFKKILFESDGQDVTIELSNLKAANSPADLENSNADYFYDAYTQNITFGNHIRISPK